MVDQDKSVPIVSGVPARVVNNATDLTGNPQLVSRGFFIQLSHPVLGNNTSDGTPIRISRTPACFRRAGPLLGQDNRYVYQDLLGLDEDGFRQYVEKGIIA